MRASERRAKRQKEAMLKGLGVGAAILAAAGGATATAITVSKKKSSKTEDTLDDVKAGE